MTIKLGKWQLIAIFVIGAISFAGGLFVIIRDVHVGGVSHATNAWLGGFLIVLSFGLMFPAQLAAALKIIKDNVGDYVPRVNVMIGGRRATDPKGLPAIKETQLAEVTVIKPVSAEVTPLEKVTNDDAGVL